MDEQPRQPGEVPGYLELAKLGDGGGAADGGEAPFVVVVEIASWLIFEVARDGFRNPVALLHRDGRDSGEQLAFFVLQRGQIADHKYFSMSGNAEIGLDEHATGAIDGNTEPAAQRRSGNACRPQDDWRENPFVAHPNRAGLDASDGMGRANFDSQSSQLFFGFAGKLLGIGWQNAGSAFNEEYTALPRVDIAELMIHGVMRDFSQGAREFDAGGSAADDDELQRRRALAAGGLPLGQFEGQ